MKKMIWMMLALFVLSVASVNVNAQVRIGGNTNPVSAAILDLNADSTTSANTKGLAIPRMVLTSTSSAAPLTRHVAGMLVYNTGNTIPTGFYYNTGSAWVKVGSGDGSLSNVAAKAGTGTTVSGKGIAGDTLTIGIANLGVNTAQLADSSVTTVKIRNNAVTNAKIPNNEIRLAKIYTSAADSGKFLMSNGTTWTTTSGSQWGGGITLSGGPTTTTGATYTKMTVVKDTTLTLNETRPTFATLQTVGILATDLCQIMPSNRLLSGVAITNGIRIYPIDNGVLSGSVRVRCFRFS